MRRRSRGLDYGIDAPGLVRGFAGGGLVAGVVALVLALAPLPGRTACVVLGWVAAAVAAHLLGMASYMVYGSKVVKVAGRERLLDLVPWTGAETVLDVGCGRGVLLVGAARRLTTGRAVGIDLWQAEDQSGNNADATLANAGLEGVGDRVEVRTADMRALPFPDRSFDLIVSHWAVHNLYAPADRKKSLAEMDRVLRPGGRVLIADIEHRDEYAAELTALGFTGVRVVVNPTWDKVRAALTFGSFRPSTVVGRKRADAAAFGGG